MLLWYEAEGYQLEHHRKSVSFEPDFSEDDITEGPVTEVPEDDITPIPLVILYGSLTAKH